MFKGKYKKRLYNVKCSCGHEMDVWIGGYDEDYRQEVLKDYKRDVCNECRNEQLNSKVNTLYPNNNFPALKGSEKQVQWAESIRNEIALKYNTEEDLANLASVDKAEFFIENRNKEHKDVLAILGEQRALKEMIPQVIKDNSEMCELENEEYINAKANVLARLYGIRRYKNVSKLDDFIDIVKNNVKGETLVKYSNMDTPKMLRKLTLKRNRLNEELEKGREE